VASDGRAVKDELGRTEKGAAVVGGMVRNHETSVGVGGNPVQIRTGHLQNTGQKRCRFSNMPTHFVVPRHDDLAKPMEGALFRFNRYVDRTSRSSS
jgi:hypothetical protein